MENNVKVLLKNSPDCPLQDEDSEAAAQQSQK